MKQIDNNSNRSARRRNKFKPKFLEKYNFFLDSYNADILTFCGSDVKTEFDENGFESKYVFREYENGLVNVRDIVKCYEPEELRKVIIGKKAWGLIVDEWTDGIAECLFFVREFFEIFNEQNIKIPESFINEFYSRLEKKKKKIEEERNEILKRQADIIKENYFNNKKK